VIISAGILDSNWPGHLFPPLILTSISRRSISFANLLFKVYHLIP
jgi:hypothetical protein